jgi:hypothetical protein
MPDIRCGIGSVCVLCMHFSNATKGHNRTTGERLHITAKMTHPKMTHSTPNIPTATTHLSTVVVNMHNHSLEAVQAVEVPHMSSQNI